MMVLTTTAGAGLSITQQPATSSCRLRNAVLISLFTDARAPADQVPEGANNRGYWGDMDLPQSESLGSCLWTLQREKITNNLLTRINNHATDALAWLIDEGELIAVNVTTERRGTDTVAFKIDCQLPNGEWLNVTAEQAGYGI
jgi:phage gp46-like protein